MNTQHKTLILGNSHTDAIKKADSSIDVHWLKNNKSVHGDTSPEDALAMVRALTPDDCLVLLHFGAMHNFISLLNHEDPFALVGGIDESMPSTMIPYRSMQAMMTAEIPTKNLVAKLSREAPCTTYHIMSPPPKEALTMPKNPRKGYRGRSMQEMGFSPAPQRLAMWRLEEETIAQYLKTIGVNHIGAVPGTQTEEGYLHPDYHAVDNTHANAAYGAKVIEHLRSLMASA